MINVIRHRVKHPICERIEDARTWKISKCLRWGRFVRQMNLGERPVIQLKKPVIRLNRDAHSEAIDRRGLSLIYAKKRANRDNTLLVTNSYMLFIPSKSHETPADISPNIILKDTSGLKRI